MLKAPPLSFEGNKKLWRKEIISIIENINFDAIYVDLFGGSGIISHWIKHLKPEAKVIYNDYDNYCERLCKIKQTNKIRRKLVKVVEGMKDNEKITDPVKKQKILDIIKHYEDPDILTLSSFLLYSYGWVKPLKLDNKLENIHLYNRVRKTDLDDNIEEYLSGLRIKHMDWEDLYEQAKERYRGKKVVYIIDPPYIYTDKSGYANNNWKIKDTLKLLKILIHEKYFIFFNSDHLGIDDIIDTMNETLDTNIRYTKLAKKMPSCKKERYEYCLVSKRLLS